HEIVGFDVREAPDCPTIVGDLGELAILERAIGQVDCVCHLAGVGDVYRAFEDPPGAAAANVVGSANVAEAALRQGKRKVVYASTWEVYGEPHYQPIDEAHPCAPDHP